MLNLRRQHVLKHRCQLVLENTNKFFNLSFLLNYWSRLCASFKTSQGSILKLSESKPWSCDSLAWKFADRCAKASSPLLFMRHEGRLHFPGEIPNGMPNRFDILHLPIPVIRCKRSNLFRWGHIAVLPTGIEIEYMPLLGRWVRLSPLGMGTPLGLVYQFQVIVMKLKGR